MGMSDGAAGPPAKTSSTDHAVVSTIVTLAPTETTNFIDAATSPDATAALWNCISYHGRPAKLKRLLTPALETDDLADSLRYDRESWLDGD